jgi:hypothetical protein
MNRLRNKKKSQKCNLIYMYKFCLVEAWEKTHVLGVQRLRNAAHTKIIQVYTHHYGVVFEHNSKVMIF